MSMIRCDRCAQIIDSDDDPECFVENPGCRYGDRVICEACRYQLECDREYYAAMASRCENEAERNAAE